jgi:osmotically-inducible protein OsmY
MNAKLGRLGAAVMLALSVSACAPLVLGGAVGGAFMVTDRRTSGAFVEDQGIELKAERRVRDNMGERVHVNVSAYNRVALLTGEVPSEADREAAEKWVASTENVQRVVNALGVLGNSSLTSRSSDIIIANKIRLTLVDARDLQSNAFKVIVERGEVYLMGMVTEREANRAAELASTVSGVQKVVKVLHIISEAELAAKLPPPSPASAASSAR